MWNWIAKKAAQLVVWAVTHPDAAKAVVDAAIKLKKSKDKDKEK